MVRSLKELQAEHEGRLSRTTQPGSAQSIIVATGIECSYPTVQNGRRRDELESTDHYRRWREDFELCRAVGARHLRYGLPYYRMHIAPGAYDWSFADEVLPAIWEADLIPIVDLCHFGVPDWIGSFQNPDWPRHFAEYASAFAERYPWIKFYTPVNEMLVCAHFSAALGLWNEQEKSDRSFVSAMMNECRADLLAIDAILARRPDAVFIQSEAAEVFLERWPGTRDMVQFKNRLRFLTFDVLYGRPPDGDVLVWLFDNGLAQETFAWFMAEGRRVAPHCVLGMDYYGDNEKSLGPEGEEANSGPMLGWGMIARDYYDRYNRPMMLTETNVMDAGGGEAVHWLLRTWHQAHHLRHAGLPMIGYTWYSLTDQVDWDIQLREIRGKVNANGLFKLDRSPREVAAVFRQLAKDYGDRPLVETLPPSLLGGVAVR